jgi:hypothetical protein
MSNRFRVQLQQTQSIWLIDSENYFDGENFDPWLRCISGMNGIERAVKQIKARKEV